MVPQFFGCIQLVIDGFDLWGKTQPDEAEGFSGRWIIIFGERIIPVVGHKEVFERGRPCGPVGAIKDGYHDFQVHGGHVCEERGRWGT